MPPSARTSRTGTSRKTGQEGFQGRLPLGPDTRLALIVSKDPFLRGLYTDQIREALLAAGVEPETIRIDGAQAEPAEILDECRSFGLLATHKLVIVDDADRLLKAREDEDQPKGPPSARGRKLHTTREMFEHYAEAPCDQTTLVLRAESWHRGKLDKAILKVGVTIKGDDLKPKQAADWVIGRAKKRLGRTVQRDAADLLVERVGVGLGRLASELAKLDASAPAGQDIAVEHVRELVGMTREEEVWTIQEPLLQDSPESALQQLHDLLIVSRIHPVLARWAYTDLARKLHHASRLLELGVSEHAMKNKLKLYWGAGQLIPEVARRASPDQWANLFSDCLEADRKAKSGIGDEVTSLEVLTLRFTSLAGA